MDYLDQTLEQLDGEIWGEPNYGSYVVTRCHAWRRVPLREFTVEHLRLLIGQHFSLEYLIPLALEQLTLDPLAEGAFYPGYLLNSVRRVPQEYWQQNLDQYAKWRAIEFRVIEPKARYGG